MNLAYDRFRLHAYVDGELTPDEIADFERLLAQDPDAMAEVTALRAQKQAMHARYDRLLTTPTADAVTRWSATRWSWPSRSKRRSASGWAFAATVLVAAAGGWLVRGEVDHRERIASGSSTGSSTGRDAEHRLQAFVQAATVSHAVFVPEVRHPVEVTAADEGHLVAWLSKRLGVPLIVPHLGDAGWELLGGRLLPADAGPIAQFMYQDARGRRMTLAISSLSVRVVDGADAASAKVLPTTAFRIAEENGATVFYWIDTDRAYALTGRLTRSEMTALAGRVHRQLTP